LPRVAEFPSLLERRSIPRLLKEIESREPEGPQDSVDTLTPREANSGERRAHTNNALKLSS
jgi:hypothetical protein